MQRGVRTGNTMINQCYLVTTGIGLLYKYVCSLQIMNSTKRHFQGSLHREQIYLIILFNYFWSEFQPNLVGSQQDSKFPPLLQEISILRIDIDPNPGRQKGRHNLLYMLRQHHSAWPGSSMFSTSFSLSQHTPNITSYKCCRSTEEKILYKCRTNLQFQSERIENLQISRTMTLLQATIMF